MSDTMLETEALLEDDESVDGSKYLMCKLGEEIYAIDIGHVTDIIELQKITAIPDMPEYVKGVINLRGQVIPIIDLRLRFRMEAREYDDRTVITVVNIHDKSVGFVVDTATEVQDILNSDVAPPPEFSSHREDRKFIQGLGKIGEQVVILLDMERMLTAEETTEIHRASEAESQ